MLTRGEQFVLVRKPVAAMALSSAMRALQRAAATWGIEWPAWLGASVRPDLSRRQSCSLWTAVFSTGSIPG